MTTRKVSQETKTDKEVQVFLKQPPADVMSQPAYQFIHKYFIPKCQNGQVIQEVQQLLKAKGVGFKDLLNKRAYLLPTWDNDLKSYRYSVGYSYHELLRLVDETQLYAGLEVYSNISSEPNYYETPVWSECKIWRQGVDRPFIKRVYYQECFQVKKDGNPNANWAKRPVQMLEKCAVAACARLAFPTALNNVFIQDEWDYDTEEVPDKPSAQDQPEEADYEVVDDNNDGLSQKQFQQSNGGKVDSNGLITEAQYNQLLKDVNKIKDQGIKDDYLDMLEDTDTFLEAVELQDRLNKHMKKLRAMQPKTAQQKNDNGNGKNIQPPNVSKLSFSKGCAAWRKALKEAGKGSEYMKILGNFDAAVPSDITDAAKQKDIYKAFHETLLEQVAVN